MQHTRRSDKEKGFQPTILARTPLPKILHQNVMSKKYLYIIASVLSSAASLLGIAIASTFVNYASGVVFAVASIALAYRAGGEDQ